MRSGSEFKDLPVYRHREDILKALEEEQVIIVESPTGSGKTTQIPLILKEAGYDQTGIIGVTQPRRIATLSICDFIKHQLGIPEDDHYCAYTMRFNDTSDDRTRIKVMTDGILLQELKDDRLLSRYSVMMVDEAHERSLNIDFILGLLKEVTTVRKDLKVIISSATINTEKFSTFFDGARIISIDAKTYPVDVIYSPLDKKEARAWGDDGVRVSETDLRLSKIYEIIERWISKESGDVLVFLPGEFEITQCEDMLLHSPFAKSLQVYPLYGRLSKEEQERVFTPTQQGMTKVVIATNIAETSITIDGIRCVIDSGLAKVNYYDQKTFTSALVTQPVSKASARQRRGRAGRTQSGTCYRLYSESEYKNREEFSKEEITRSDLAEVALRMSELGIYDYDNFPFITSPRKSALASAEYTLRFIGAIDEAHHLTSIGEMMVRFPLLPRLSRSIVEAIMRHPDVLSEVLVAASFLSTKGPFLFPKDKAMLARSRQERFQDSTYGDFAGYLKLYKSYMAVIEKDDQKARERFCRQYFLDIQTMNEIVHIKKQLEEIVSTFGVPITGGGQMSEYLTCLASGLVQFVCVLDDGSSYRSLTADAIYIHPSCSWFRMKPSYILAGEVVQTSRMFARSVSPLKAEWVDEVHPRLRTLLRYSSSHGYENLEKDLQRGLAKEERKASSKKQKVERKDGPLNVFGITLQQLKKQKKSGRPAGESTYILPIEKLDQLVKEAFKAGSVPKLKVTLSCPLGLMPGSLTLKTVIQEGSLVSGKKPLDNFRDETYPLSDAHMALAERLGDLFSPARSGGRYFGFLALGQAKNKKDCFRVYLSTSLPGAVDNTYSSITELIEACHHDRKRYGKLLKEAEAIKARLDKLEGLDEH